tara:strand:+ start:35 stop:580 length:546 start_codon:yes stop_codon:yes gene_type:complete
MTVKGTFTSGSVPIGTLGVNMVKSGSSGGGIRGIMPPPMPLVNKEYNVYGHSRFSITNAWNTTYPSQLRKASRNRIITPFRAVTNSGDLLSRQSYTCGGSCQTFQSRPGLHGMSLRFGNISSVCDDTGVPPASCNTKYVYDSSNYIKFKKQSAFAKNYNDITYGGDDSHAAQSALRNLRRR